MAENLDELLRPTMADARPQATRPPYRVSSQGYVAFFGGVLAVTIVALINARRLRMSSRSQLLMAGAGALAVAGEVVAATLITGDQTPRLIRTLAALAAFGVFYWLQRSPERVYEYHAKAEEPYESLVPLGIAVCLVPGIPELAVLGQL
jgi:ABC-type Fe3+-siderophore transport system permease subunit